MARHRLTAAQFAALGSGYGDAAAMGVLRAGQASRRRLMLRAVAEAEPRALPALRLLSRAGGPEADAVLGHPMLGVWANASLRRERWDLCYLTGLAAAAAVRAGLAFELGTRAEDGTVVLPTLGVAEGLGAGPVWIRCDGTALSLTGPITTVTAASPYSVDSPGWTAARHGDGFTIEDRDPYRDCFGWPSMPPGQPAAAVGEAWRLIEAWYPRHAEAMRGSLRLLVPLRRPPGGHEVSAASRLAFGAIGVSLPADPWVLAELIIHEFQHMKLGALLDIVALYRPGGMAIHWAPWRTDPRPVGALLQGTYAHAGVTDFWRTRQRTDPAGRLEFAYWLEQTSRAAATLVASGELSDAGQRFVGYLSETLATWRATPVPAVIREYARDLADITLVRWHLDRAGTGGEAGSVKPTQLVTLIRQRATQPSAAVDGDLANTSYVMGDYHGSALAYRQRIARDPTDSEAWAGLAISLRRTGAHRASATLIERPHHVRAARERTHADPAHLAETI